MNLAPGTKLGPCEIVSLLGVGGMGEVYRARDSRLKRDVANFDAAGNLYGETRSGGRYGGGTVFELTADSSGSWTETILHGHGTDRIAPVGGLAFDATGNLYGATVAGGKHQYGMVFEITP